MRAGLSSSSTPPRAREELGTLISTERRPRWLLGGLGAGSFSLLLLIEVATEGDALTSLDVATDALSLALTIGAAVGVALLAQRMQSQRE